MPIRSIIRTPTRPHACRCPGACAARNIWPARKGEVTGIPPHSAVSECSVDRFRACQPVHLGTSTREGHTQDLPTRPGRGLQLGVAIASMLDDVDDGFASLLQQHHQPPANLERPRRLWPPSTDWFSLPRGAVSEGTLTQGYDDAASKRSKRWPKTPFIRALRQQTVSELPSCLSLSCRLS
ncbi:hypothetical protein GQ607_005026 [Colletotrichum asianum]|uniref:Uncharacterized protein n=1 Tax=Colletotrichum asianum TaxID=702518 RepID=A0A8H3ZUE8_9PEZI|nr:hypothetical protein GQ607_005026 [Colletotrichum asianum]